MSAFPSTVQTSLGQTFHLAKQIGQGGEGAIYEVREQTDLALKLYWPTKAESRREKISTMASAQWYKTNSFVAFPIAILFSPTGAFLGFVMRKVGGGKPVHLLFSPTSRKIEFAAADYRFLVRAASNIARAVASVHALSCVILLGLTALSAHPIMTILDWRSCYFKSSSWAGIHFPEGTKGPAICH
jgi:DNA-binding helix-hairpin-helix protein with protein kinase domain